MRKKKKQNKSARLRAKKRRQRDEAAFFSESTTSFDAWDEEMIHARVERSRLRREQKLFHREKQRKKQRKRRIFSVLTGAAVLVIGFFSFRWVRDTFFVQTLSELPTIRNEALQKIENELLVTDTKGRSLTQAERSADVQQLLDSLENWMPTVYRTALEKSSFLEATQTTRRAAEEATSDAQFFYALREMVRAQQEDKTDILDPVAYFSLQRELGSAFYEVSSPYGKVIDSPRASERYQRLLDEQKADPSLEIQPMEENALSVRTEGSTVIVSGLAFSTERIETDRAVLTEQQAQIGAATTLVFDLRGCAGESEMYWCRALVPLFAQNDVGASTTVFFRDSMPDFLDYLSVRENVPEFDLDDDRTSISMLLPAELQEEISDMNYGKKLTYSIPKQDDTQFSGSVYLLVDEGTKNAADTFASFCQATHIATIAGKSTGGGGWELPPILVQLPHSGYILRMRSGVALSPDETHLQKKGTVPDFSLEEGDLLESLLSRLP